MELSIDIHTIITAASLITALGVIFGVFVKLQKFIEKHEKNAQDIKEVKTEQKLMFSALFACLDGLEQLGANHTVPKAKNDLEQWLTEQAHKD